MKQVKHKTGKVYYQTIFILLLFISSHLLLAQQWKEWPQWLGPDYNLSQEIPPGRETVGSESEIRRAWISEEITPLAGCFNVPYESMVPLGAGASPVVSNGKLFYWYLWPSGQDMDTIESWRHEDNIDHHQYKIDDSRIQADDVVLCVDTKTGKTLWKKVFKEKGYNYWGHKININNNTMTVFGDKVFVAGSTWRLYCLDANTGNLIWESTEHTAHAWMEGKKQESIEKKNRVQDCNRSANGSLTVVDSVLIAPQNIACVGMGYDLAFDIYGFDIETGQKIWTAPNVLGGKAQPTVWENDGKKYIVAADNNAELSLIDPKNGNILWTVSGLGINDKSSIVFGDYVIVEEDGPNVACYELSQDTAIHVWSLPDSYGTPSNKHGIVGYNDTLIIRTLKSGASNETWLLVDIQTGNIIEELLYDISRSDEAWVARLGDVIITELNSQHCDNVIDILTTDPADFRKLVDGWHTPHPHTTSYSVPINHPLAEGKIFMRGAGGIYCYDLLKDSGNVTVDITTPSIEKVYKFPETSITIEALASTTSGSITKVEFYEDGIYTGESGSSPYTHEMSNLQLGTYAITAKAYSSTGEVKESHPVMVKVITFADLDIDPDTSIIEYLGQTRVMPVAKDQNGDYLPDSLQPFPQQNMNWSLIEGGILDTIFPSDLRDQQVGLYSSRATGIFKIVVSSTIKGITLYDTAIVRVAKAGQTITFNPLEFVYITDSYYVLSATASSGLPVSYTVVSGSATVSNDTLYLNNTGDVVVKASQSGSVNYRPATDVERTIEIKSTPVLSSVEITPQKAYIPVTGKWVYEAVAYDQGGTALREQPGLTWTTSGGGTIDGNGTYSAGSSEGTWEVYVSATEGAVTVKDTATVEVTPRYKGISINFVDGGKTDYYIQSQEFAGAVKLNNWNNQWSSDIKNNIGQTVTTSVSLSNGWDTEGAMTGVKDADIKMLRSVKGNYSGTTTITITDVPTEFTSAPGGYSVYLYNLTNRGGAYSIGTDTVFFEPVSDFVWDGNHVISENNICATAVHANGAKLTGLTDTNITVTLNQGSHVCVGQGTIAGMQIIAEETSSTKYNQTITFISIGDQYYQGVGTSIELNGTASSGLPVYYTVTSGPANVSGSTLQLTGTGTVTVEAWQPGNDYYNAAFTVPQTFDVLAKENQSVTWNAIANPYAVSSLPHEMTLTATAGSGLAVKYLVLEGIAGIINGSTLWIGEEGTVTVRAEQAGNDQYYAAEPIIQTFEVMKIITGEKPIVQDKNTEINVYPNPTTGMLTIEGLTGNSRISVVNILGAVLDVKIADGNVANLDISHLSSGIYLLKISSGDYVEITKIQKK